MQGIYWKPERGAKDHIVLPSPAQQQLLVFPVDVAATPTATPFPTSDALTEQLTAATPPWVPREFATFYETGAVRVYQLTG